VRRGFSLVELVVVLLLLGMTAALSAPALMSALDRDETHASVRAVRTLLEDSRSLALERGTRVDLVIDAGDARYWVMAGDDSATTGRLALNTDTRLQSRRDRVHFMWDARAASWIDTLHVTTGTGRTMLTVDPWSGAVIVK
jgi:prepilin-type N-terminal cleavage/methylation domain-containing protein